jgi:hypothetical protein
MGCIVILVGLVSGVIAGYFTGWLVEAYHITPGGPGWLAAAGAFGGAVFGGILGTISGDLNKASTSSGAGGGGKFLLAALSGAIAGALGGSKFQIIGELMTQFRIPSPF